MERKWSEGYKKKPDEERELLLDIARQATALIEIEQKSVFDPATPEMLMAAKIALQYSVQMYEKWKDERDEKERKNRALANRGSV